jgi:hypothetical protein
MEGLENMIYTDSYPSLKKWVLGFNDFEDYAELFKGNFLDFKERVMCLVNYYAYDCKSGKTVDRDDIVSKKLDERFIKYYDYTKLSNAELRKWHSDYYSKTLQTKKGDI